MQITKVDSHFHALHARNFYTLDGQSLRPLYDAYEGFQYRSKQQAPYAYNTTSRDTPPFEPEDPEGAPSRESLIKP